MYPISIEGALAALLLIVSFNFIRRFLKKARLSYPGGYAVLAEDRMTEIKEVGLKSYLVKGATKIFEGSIVGVNSSGYALPAADAAGIKVVGVANETVDNTAGADGALNIVVRTFVLAKFDATSITQAMVGQVMYVVDDHTFDDTVGTNGITAGVLAEYISATEGWIFVGVDSLPNVKRTAAEVNLLTQGVAAGYKIARGQQTTVAAVDTVVTGLTTVVAVVASYDDDPGDANLLVSATIGNQAGAPAAGSIIIKTWKTDGVDPTPVAATAFGKKVNWIAVGT